MRLTQFSITAIASVVFIFLFSTKAIGQSPEPGNTVNQKVKKYTKESIDIYQDTSLEPNDIIRAFSNNMIEVYRDTSLHTRKNLEKLLNDVHENFTNFTNFNEIAVRTLGPKARQLSTDQIDTFALTFSDLIFEVYKDRFITQVVEDNSWDLEKFEILNQQFRFKQKYALVQTEVVLSKSNVSRNIPLDFKFVKRDQNWRIYDIIVERFSLVENYRSQFSEILSNHDFSYLLNQLQTMVEKKRTSQDSVVQNLNPLKQ